MSQDIQGAISEAPPPATQEPPPPRPGCLTALMILGGVVLLLPGACALLLASDGMKVGGEIGAITLLLALGGFTLIRAAFGGRR